MRGKRHVLCVRECGSWRNAAFPFAGPDEINDLLHKERALFYQRWDRGHTSASSAGQAHGRAGNTKAKWRRLQDPQEGTQLSPKSQLLWLLDKKPFSLLQGPSSCMENSVTQKPEEFRNCMPITSWRCIQERTGQVIELKNDFIATITKSLSILFLKLVLATKQSHISETKNLKLFSNITFSIKNRSEGDLYSHT